ncbi:unnamed protein product [Ixodes pacificus]
MQLITVTCSNNAHITNKALLASLVDRVFTKCPLAPRIGTKRIYAITNCLKLFIDKFYIFADKVKMARRIFQPPAHASCLPSYLVCAHMLKVHETLR